VEGAVSFGDNGAFTLRPIRGHYKGNTGSRPLDRPMTQAERKPMNFVYDRRTEGDKRHPYEEGRLIAGLVTGPVTTSQP
jgi:hypothetical protein